ncbi:MAG: HNH endonuclease, partial [Candidatus Rokubacteria bacterium]|nr:HNH endonuclease [Candidatus Rokubacteria bacterium]
METHRITVLPDPEPIAALRRLGDEIAELAAHLDAATARLLDLIREFDAREGWSGFPSCAAWLSYRVGLGPRAAREKV